jgi:hypothetical protein
MLIRIHLARSLWDTVPWRGIIPVIKRRGIRIRPVRPLCVVGLAWGSVARLLSIKREVILRRLAKSSALIVRDEPAVVGE